MCFDGRASLSRDTARAAALAIVDAMALGPGERLLELGPGTGEIGAELLAIAEGYVGIDDSPSMLEQFRARVAPATPQLFVANADRVWPVDDASVRGVFLSRVVHLLEPKNLLRELARVKHAAGLTLILGRRVRDPDAPAARLRAELHILLEALRYTPRRADRVGARLLDSLVESGAVRLAPSVAARRSLRTSYRIELDAWRHKGGLAGLTLPAEVRNLVLDDLERWAEREVGDLEASVDAGEAYAIDGVRLG